MKLRSYVAKKSNYCMCNINDFVVHICQSITWKIYVTYSSSKQLKLSAGTVCRTNDK